MDTLLLVSQIVLTVFITVSVLLQKSSSIGLGAYSGSNESVFGAKGSGGFLSKLTFALALIFVVNTVALGYSYSVTKRASVVDSIDDSAIPDAPVIEDIVPDAPKSGELFDFSNPTTNEEQTNQEQTNIQAPQSENSPQQDSSNKGGNSLFNLGS